MIVHISNANNSGFTLIEMAMVMVIIGLLAGMAMPLMSMLIKQGKYAEERAGVVEAKLALIGAGITQGGFPDALENNVLPVSGLGIRTTNPYTKPLLYDVNEALLASNTGGNLATMCSNLETIISDNSGPHIWPATDYTDTSIASQLAFVVISSGANYKVDGENTPLGILGDRVYENPATGSTEVYDDVVGTYALTQLCTDCSHLGYNCVTPATIPEGPDDDCTAAAGNRCASITNNTAMTLYWAIDHDTKNASPCNELLPGASVNAGEFDEKYKLIISPGLDSKDTTKCDHKNRYMDDKLQDIDSNNDQLASVICNVIGKDNCDLQ